jgi:hypothetical protein
MATSNHAILSAAKELLDADTGVQLQTMMLQPLEYSDEKFIEFKAQVNTLAEQFHKSVMNLVGPVFWPDLSKSKHIASATQCHFQGPTQIDVSSEEDCQ